MSTMLVELYDALREAGASEGKARAAATSNARPDERFDRVDHELTAVRADIARLDKELAVVKAQIDLLKSMNGIVIAGVAALINRAFFS
jgi:hypothetical protein